VIAPTQSIKGWFNGYRKAAREEFGYEAGPDRFGWVTPVYIGDTDKKAVEEAREPIEWYFHKSLRQPPGAGLPPGYVPLDSMQAALNKGTRRIPTDTMPIEELIKGGYILVGSADTVAEKLAELEEELGFATLGTNLTVGSISENQARENIEAFAKEVMPRFRKAEPAEPDKPPVANQ
jgi:alkanesulfonate monooxygenase SsuD/methylene tetrahydromethanopterin reductase-like flavin-dependent oxidoreductase (luciferase family)